MKNFAKIVSAVVSIVLVALTMQFDIGKTIIYYIGAASTMGTITVIIYAIIDSLCEWWCDNVKDKKK